MAPQSITQVPQRVWRTFQRSVAAKLCLSVGLSVLAIVLIYTYLLSSLRDAWFRERMVLSQLMIHHEVHNYFESSDGDHAGDATDLFLDELATKTRIERIQIKSPLWRPPAESEPADTSGAALPGALGLPPSSPVDASAVPQNSDWRVVMPLANHRSCFDCHGDVNPVASIVVDFPKAQIMDSRRTAQLQLFGYGGAVLVLTLLIVLVMIWWLVLDPLYRLSATVRQARHGDLQVTCDVRGDDQFGELADGLNGMLEAVRDRHETMQRGYESTIARAERLATVGQLASGLAHEIKNPLHSVSGALSIIEKRVDDPKLREVTVDMQHEMQRVTAIVHDLLQYARPKPADPQSIAIKPVVEQIMRLLQPDAQKRGVALQTEIADPTLAAQVDAHQLHQILLNLVLNAIQASSDGGRVTIRLRVVPGVPTVQIDVNDDGHGIPADLRDSVFDPFFTTRHDGHGLGLPITRTLAEQNGGTVILHDRPGPGTCFRVLLPYAPHTDDPETAEAPRD